MCGFFFSFSEMEALATVLKVVHVKTVAWASSSPLCGLHHPILLIYEKAKEYVSEPWKEASLYRMNEIYTRMKYDLHITTKAS